MILLLESYAHLFIALLALCGFFVALHIYKHKKPESAPLVCPMKFDCHAVVHSDYSKFLNIPLEILGMIYYAFTFLAYIFLIIFPQDLPVFLTLLLVLLSKIAFLFSLYLIGVQIFILKKGCFWCFISALISILIFILALYLYNIPELLLNLSSIYL